MPCDTTRTIIRKGSALLLSPRPTGPPVAPLDRRFPLRDHLPSPIRSVRTDPIRPLCPTERERLQAAGRPPDELFVRPSPCLRSTPVPRSRTSCSAVTALPSPFRLPWRLMSRSRSWSTASGGPYCETLASGEGDAPVPA